MSWFKKSAKVVDAGDVSRNWDEIITATVRMSDNQVDSAMTTVSKNLNLNLSPTELRAIDPKLKKQLIAINEMNRKTGLNIDLNKGMTLEVAKKAEPVPTSTRDADRLAEVLADHAGKTRGEVAKENAKALWKKYRALGGVAQAGIAGITVILVLGVFGVKPSDLLRMGGEEMGDILGTLSEELVNMAGKATSPITSPIMDFLSNFWYVFLIIALIFIVGGGIYLVTTMS